MAKSKQPESRQSNLISGPPTSLVYRDVSEAEKAFLDAAEPDQQQHAQKVPIIEVNHKGGDHGSFVMPDGSSVDGTDGISAFIVGHFATRAYFEKSYVPGGEKGPPDCKSTNCIVPDEDSPSPQSTTCATCPMNEFETAKVGKGKACKEKLWLLLVNPAFGSSPIALLALPPTSLGVWYGGKFVTSKKRGYLDQLMAKSPAWKIIWSHINLERGNEEDVHVTPVFTMGEMAGTDIVPALAKLNNQFVQIVKSTKRTLPVTTAEDADHDDGSADEGDCTVADAEGVEFPPR